MAYTFGFVIEEQPGPPPASQEELAFLATQSPMVVAAIGGRDILTNAEQFDWGLQVVIQGLQTLSAKI